MQTGVIVALAALSLVGAGVVGASGVMAPAWGQGGMQGGMGTGPMGGGTGMHGGMDGMDGGMMGDGTCPCPADCPQHAYAYNYSGGP